MLQDMMSGLDIQVNMMRVSKTIHIAWVVLTSFWIILPSFPSCTQGARMFCNSTYDTECPAGMFCDNKLLPTEQEDIFVCTQKFYNSCQSSFDCASDYQIQSGECVFLLPNETLSLCSDMTKRGENACFCSPMIWDYFPFQCDINTAEIDTTFDENKYCVPCSFLSPPNVTSAHNACRTKYVYQKPPLGKNGSSFHSCDNNLQYCNDGLQCSIISGNYTSRCSSRLHEVSAVNNCFCIDTEATSCSSLSSCSIGSSCIRLPTDEHPVCVPSDSLSRVTPSPPIMQTNTSLKHILLALSVMELTFVVCKSVALSRTEKGWLLFAVICFIFETIIGLSLTVIQCYIVLQLNLSHDVVDVGLIIGASLFVLTEICAVISEAIFVNRKVKNQKAPITNNENRFRFSLVYRVVVKWVTFFISIALVILASRLSFAYSGEGLNFLKIILPSMAATIICYSIFTLFYYCRYWARVITSTTILIISFVITMNIIFKNYKFGPVVFDNQFVRNSCGTFRDGYLFPLILAFNVFLTAISSFRLHGCDDLKSITAEQVEFFETAVFGLSYICIFLSTVLCADEAIVLFLVACPQVGVLLVPFLFEYTKALFFTIRKRWINSPEDEQKSVP